PGVLYPGLFPAVVAGLAWMHGGPLLGPTGMALFYTLLPIITACIATLVLGERLTVHHLVGGAARTRPEGPRPGSARRPARLRSATC
uniref:EamA family transporter n=1 Tax=Pseudomonas aeruginosa TaxID=287 RepID=UPI0013A54AA4